MNWVEFVDVTLGYDGRPVVCDLSFSLPVGTAVGLAGPNGAGKTTILKGVLGLLRPMKGSIRKGAESASATAYVPQRGSISDVFPFTLEEIVEMGLYGKLKAWNKPTTEQKAKINDCLKALELAEFRNKHFRDLSGGQKQRTLLARALVAEPNVMILDEPTYGLDLAQSLGFFEFLHDLRHKRSISSIVVSHNLNELLANCDYLLLLHDGRLAFAGDIASLSDEILSKIYGRRIKLCDSQIRGSKNE